MAGDPDLRPLLPDTVAPPGGHYSPGVAAAGFVFVAGQLPIAADGRKLNGEPFEAQVRQVLYNVAAVLLAAGTSIDRLVQVRVYLSDVALWGEFNRLYAAWAGDAKPARAVVPVPALHHGFLVEVEAVALAA